MYLLLTNPCPIWDITSDNNIQVPQMFHHHWNYLIYENSCFLTDPLNFPLSFHENYAKFLKLQFRKELAFGTPAFHHLWLTWKQITDFKTPENIILCAQKLLISFLDWYCLGASRFPQISWRPPQSKSNRQNLCSWHNGLKLHRFSVDSWLEFQKFYLNYQNVRCLFDSTSKDTIVTRGCISGLIFES